MPERETAHQDRAAHHQEGRPRLALTLHHLGTPGAYIHHHS